MSLLSLLGRQYTGLGKKSIMRTITSLLCLATTLWQSAAFIPQPRSATMISKLATRTRGGSSLLGARGLQATAAVAPAVKKLTSPVDYLNSIDVFIFDCDGVIWRGDSLIEKVPAVLDKLRQMGKR